MVFIDIHCHLDMCRNIPSIIKRASKKKVGIIMTQGVNPPSNRISLELSEEYPEVKSALGLYPIDALKLSDSEIEKEISFIEKNRDRISAIGEVGLDFKEDEENHERQEKIFRQLIALSVKIRKPIIVHSRKAELEAIEMLEEMKAKKVIMHCFCGKWSLVERIIKNSWFLTIPTNVAFSQQFQDIAEKIPLENLFCETDSPFLHPQKEKYNEPSLILESYRKISELKKINLIDVEEKIKSNFDRLFKQQLT